MVKKVQNNDYPAFIISLKSKCYTIMDHFKGMIILVIQNYLRFLYIYGVTVYYTAIPFL